MNKSITLYSYFKIDTLMEYHQRIIQNILEDKPLKELKDTVIIKSDYFKLVYKIIKRLKEDGTNINNLEIHLEDVLKIRPRLVKIKIKLPENEKLIFQLVEKQNELMETFLCYLKGKESFERNKN